MDIAACVFALGIAEMDWAGVTEGMGVSFVEDDEPDDEDEEVNDPSAPPEKFIG